MVAVVIVAAEALGGIVTGNAVLMFVLMAVTFFFAFKIYFRWDQDRPPNMESVSWLSMYPGFGYAYLGDWIRAAVLWVLTSAGVFAFFGILFLSPDADADFAIASWILCLVLSVTTSVFGSCGLAGNMEVESVNEALEINIKDGGGAIRKTTVILSVLFVLVCVFCYPVPLWQFAVFVSLWIVHAVLNLTLYAVPTPQSRRYRGVAIWIGFEDILDEECLVT